jgi:hypothetical protein
LDAKAMNEIESGLIKSCPVLFPLVLLLLICGWAAAATIETVDVDSLKRNVIVLPNGGKAMCIVYNDHNWHEVDVAVLSGAEVVDRDVCVEVKFDAMIPPDKIKLFGQQGAVILGEAEKFRLAAEQLKRDDNLWLCGELRQKKDGKGVELHVIHLAKQPPDLQKYENQIAAREKNKDAEGLIETGYKIEQLRKNNLSRFDQFDKLGLLRLRAWEKGLALKEAALKPDDVDGLFAVAQQWRDLCQNHSKFRQGVVRVLELDPDHPRASRVAEQELGLIKFEDKWMRDDQLQERINARKAAQEIQNRTNKAALDEQTRALAQAVANRPLLLARFQAALRTGAAAERAKAAEELGREAAASPDVGFGEAAVDILANLSDAGAVSPGLETALKSGVAELRGRIFEALVWRRRQEDAAALRLLARALSAEKNVETARLGVEALTALGGKAAAGVLVESLNTPERAVREECMDGLKTLTRQSLGTKEEWEEWWRNNKEEF